MKCRIHNILGISLILLFIFSTISIHAQEKEITVKLVKDINGETHTFEKTYSSREEMENDPESVINVSAKKSTNVIYLNRANRDSTVVVELKKVGDKDVIVWKNGKIVNPDSLVDIQLVRLDSGNHILFNTDSGDAFEFITRPDDPDNPTIILSDHHLKTNMSAIILLENVSPKELEAAGLKKRKELALDEFSYYPNPSQGMINVEFKAEAVPTEVRLLDMTGKVVFSKEMENFEGKYNSRIHMYDLDPGIYILEILQKDRAIRKKIILENK